LETEVAATRQAAVTLDGARGSETLIETGLLEAPSCWKEVKYASSVGAERRNEGTRARDHAMGPCKGRARRNRRTTTLLLRDPVRDVESRTLAHRAEGTGGSEPDRRTSPGGDEMTHHAGHEFDYEITKDGRVFISCDGRVVVTLAGQRAETFIEKIEDLDEAGEQLLMARMTGNFKRGNERADRSDEDW